MNVMVFDIGGVLVDWDPARAFVDQLGSREAADAFMERVDFKSKNTRADKGETFADLAREIVDVTDRAVFSTYVENYSRTVEDRIEGTWVLLDRLRDVGTPVHAITNWSAETWPEGLKTQPRLGEVFDTLVVSGREGMMKPDRAIFDLFCDRAGVERGDCLFTDDGLHNVEGARNAGLHAVQFTTPEQLERDLVARGFL